MYANLARDEALMEANLKEREVSCVGACADNRRLSIDVHVDAVSKWSLQVCMEATLTRKAMRIEATLKACKATHVALIHRPAWMHLPM